MGPFPCFLGTTRRSDSLTTLPPGFVSFAVAVPPLPVFRSCGGRAPISHRPGVLTGSPHRFSDVESSGPPRFLGDPLCTCPALRPRRDQWARPFAAPRCCLPLVQRRRLSHDSYLSRLNHAAHALAVYASQPGSPRHHARLASGWGPPLPGRHRTCWIPREVSTPLDLLHRFLLTQASPGALNGYVETSGDFGRLMRVAGRLAESGAPQRVLKVPHRHLLLAAAALQRAGVSARVRKMHDTKGFFVYTRR
jgi:hypothetical protein